ncbi:MAG: nitrate reductase NapE component, partial [Gammaproteobacteria bacterium]
ELLDSSVLMRSTYLFLCVALFALCVLGGAKSFGFNVEMTKIKDILHHRER